MSKRGLRDCSQSKTTPDESQNSVYTRCSCRVVYPVSSPCSGSECGAVPFRCSRHGFEGREAARLRRGRLQAPLEVVISQTTAPCLLRIFCAGCLLPACFASNGRNHVTKRVHFARVQVHNAVPV